MDQADHDFMEHTFHFGNGIQGELRSYGYNGGPHLFKAKKYIQNLLDQAEEKGINSDIKTDDLAGLAYELLNKNELINARVFPVLYEKSGNTHLLISAKPAQPFTIRENVHFTDNLSQSELNISSTGKVAFSADNPVFFIKHGILYTPKVENHQQPSIIRDTIIECAIVLGYPVIEKSIIINELKGSEAVFFSNLTHEMSFVQRLQDLTFTSDWRETMAMDLLMMFRQQATNEDFWNYSII